MSTEVTVFLATVALALVHLVVPVLFTIAQNGIMPVLGARDNLSSLENVYGQRMDRANNNFKETLPLALGLLILVELLGRQSGISAMGAWLYLGARLVYIPCYLFGIPVARTASWGVSATGLAMITLAIAG